MGDETKGDREHLRQVTEEIYKRANIVDVISSYNVELIRREGQPNLESYCPLPKHPSLSEMLGQTFLVDPQKQIFYCRGCKKSGDLINFVMYMHNDSKVQAIALLAKQLKIPFDYAKLGIVVQEAAEEPLQKAAEEKPGLFGEAFSHEDIEGDTWRKRETDFLMAAAKAGELYDPELVISFLERDNGRLHMAETRAVLEYLGPRLKQSKGVQSQMGTPLFGESIAEKMAEEIVGAAPPGTKLDRGYIRDLLYLGSRKNHEPLNARELELKFTAIRSWYFVQLVRRLDSSITSGKIKAEPAQIEGFFDIGEKGLEKLLK